MSKSKAKAIPVNEFSGEFGSGIVIERIAFKDLPDLEEWGEAERHDRRTFFGLEEGEVTMEIDFQIYQIKAPSLIYIHPDQVHQMLGFKDVVVFLCKVTQKLRKWKTKESFEAILRRNIEGFGF